MSSKSRIAATLLFFSVTVIMIASSCGGGGSSGGAILDGNLCAGHPPKACFEGNVYLYDECGERQQLYQTCEEGSTCTDGECVFVWAKTYDDLLFCYSAVELPGGGYATVGTSETGNLMKISVAGEKEWVKSAGDFNAYDISKTTDNGYIMAGMASAASSSPGDAMLVALDSNWNTAWSGTWNTGDDMVFLQDVQQTSAGGFISAGMMYGASSYFDLYMVKTDSSGTLEWEKGTDEYTLVSSIVQSSDGGYIVTGRTYSDTYMETVGAVVKFDSTGELVWEYELMNAWRYSRVRRTDNGGYVAAGSTEISYVDDFGNLVGKVLSVVELDEDGNLAWEGSWNQSIAYMADFIITSDGDFVFAGNTDISGDDVWILKTDSSLNLVWEHTYVDGSSNEILYSVSETSDGGYILTGESAELSEPAKGLIIKIGPDGSCADCF